MATTTIEWADAVWNPVTGCTPVSPGCFNCYAQRMAQRLKGRCGYPADEPFRVTLHPDRLDEPRNWRKPRRIFVCSMGDLFHEAVPYSYVDQVMATICLQAKHAFLVLSKRPRRMAEYFAVRSGVSVLGGLHVPYPLKNLWVGTSCENQAAADERIPWLLQTPAVLRFVSCEPLLGPIDLTEVGGVNYSRPGGDRRPLLRYDALRGREHCGPAIYEEYGRVDWVIAGGESGSNGRPCHPDWVRGLRDQCQASGTPFIFKQWGRWRPFFDRDLEDPDWRRVPAESSSVTRINADGGHGFHGERVVYFRTSRGGKTIAGREIDGREWMQFPSSVSSCPS